MAARPRRSPSRRPCLIAGTKSAPSATSRHRAVYVFTQLCVYTYTQTHTDIHILVYTYTALKQAIDARIKQLNAKGEWEQEKPEE